MFDAWTVCPGRVRVPRCLCRPTLLVIDYWVRARAGWSIVFGTLLARAREPDRHRKLEFDAWTRGGDADDLCEVTY